MTPLSVTSESHSGTNGNVYKVGNLRRRRGFPFPSFPFPSERRNFQLATAAFCAPLTSFHTPFLAFDPVSHVSSISFSMAVFGLAFAAIPTYAC